ncbi:MAG: PKD domain-containing protein [Salibacteraceae bacterium]
MLDVTMGSYTYYPSIVPLQREAIYMSYRQFGVPGICRACFPEAQAGPLLAHEVGHYFNLLHVLHPNACNESNCQTQGDYCCDTPPVNYPVNFLGCRSRNLSGCPETTLPLQHNYMDYIRSECMSVFTPDQVHRMHSSLLVYPQRINLWSEANLQQTGVACRPGQFPTGTCNLTTYFDYTEHPAANCQVQFENLSWVRPGAFAQSWDWEFGDGNSSNLKNPIHQYASTGTYDVCLVVHGKSKDGGSCTDTWCTTLVVGSCAPANDQGCFLSGSPDLWPLNCYTEFRANLHLPANGTVSHLEWNFGDGNTSNNPRPVHQYTQPGTYPVSLSATVVTAVGEVCDWYYSENLEVHCDLSTVNFFRTTGAEELSSQSNSDWKIFPNPATSWVGISSEGPLPTIVRVFDLQRKEIQVTVKPTSHVLRLSTHHLPSGLYLLELSNSLTTEHQWLVVAPE